MEQSVYDTTEFLKEFKSGSQWAFKIVYDITIGKVKACIYKYWSGIPEHIQQETIAEVYYRLFLYRESFKNIGHISSWTITVMNNFVRDNGRKLHTRRRRDKVFHDLINQEDQEPEVPKEHYQMLLRSGVDRLPLRMKRVITSNFYEGKTSALIAQEMNISKQTVLNLRSRAIKRLREFIPSSVENRHFHLVVK